MAVGVLLLKVPLPLLLQVAEPAPPPNEPDMVAVPSEQIVCDVPALTVGIGLTVIVLVSLIAVQGAVALEVSIKVTVPVKFAAGV